MSIEELQARIDKLSEDIILQKEVLKQLERSKSEAQSQLNSVLNTIRDPVARLPVEISSEIFLQSLPPAQQTSRPHDVPMLLLNICRVWHEIALSTPALWAAIRLGVTRPKILRVWLQRAQNYPLSISLYRSLDSGVAVVLRQHANQLKHLEIYDVQLQVDVADLGALSCLETFILGGLMVNHEDTDLFGLAEVMGLLRLAPNLAECTLDMLRMGDMNPSEEKLVLPRLTSLKFGAAAQMDNIDGDDHLLEHLSLPALQELSLPFCTIRSPEFLLFLQRSSPPLQKLGFGAGSYRFSFAEFDTWLRIVPSLTHLDLYTEQETFVEVVFSALADPSSLGDFLPNLQSLRIQQGFRGLSESACQAASRALSARRSQLVCVQVKSLHSPSSKPSAEVVETLRQLATDGMDIYLGDWQTNFIL